MIPKYCCAQNKAIAFLNSEIGFALPIYWKIIYLFDTGRAGMFIHEEFYCFKNAVLRSNVIFVDLLAYEKGEIGDSIYCAIGLFLKWTLPKKVE